MAENEPHELKYKVSVLVFIIQVQYQSLESHLFVDKQISRREKNFIWKT